MEDAEVMQSVSCCNCKSKFPCNYFGKKPRGSKNIIFKEDVYFMKDPFSPKEDFLVVGGHCSQCEATVCVDAQCSIYFCKRYCKGCAKTNITKFPTIVQQEINKMK